MLRTTGVVAGVAMFVMGLGGTASANEPVDTVVRTVESLGTVDVPGELPGGGGITVPRVVGGDTIVPARPRLQSAVVGYIQIARTTAGGTSHEVFGALKDPTQWSCSGGGTLSYTVTCTPLPSTVTINYRCDVLNIHVSAVTPGSSGRTSMDCNSDGVPEAQTGQVFGPGGYDTVSNISGVPVTRFTCTLDLGVPDVYATCGDPGLVGVE